MSVSGAAWLCGITIMSKLIRLFPALMVYTGGGTLLPAQSLAQHAREVEMAVSLYGKPVPKWEHGFMVLYQHDIQPPEVSLFNNEGKMVMTASIVIPEAARVWIEGAAVSKMGAVAVAGPAMKNDGAASAFITWLRNDGTVERLVRTSPFAVRRLCFASDGTLWAAGRERSDDGRTEPPHNILRHYDKNGQMVGSYLPNADFTKHNGEAAAEDSFLMSTNDRIGLYSASSRVFVELDYSGTVLGRWDGLTSHRTFDITGAGMLSGGSVYLSGRRNIPGTVSSTPEYYALDKQNGVWIRLDAAGLVGYIGGTEDDQLVFANGRSRFTWITAK